MESKLEQFNDYENLKSKFEELTINYESSKIEFDNCKSKADSSDSIINDLKEQLEILELEADVVAR